VLKNHARNFLAVWKRPRWRWALAVSLVSDAISFGLEALSLGLAEPPQLVVDFLTAAALVALLGFRWTLALPLFAEAVPATSAFPSWVLAVAALAALEPQHTGEGTNAKP
jgi:hypothetical protein